MAIEVGVWRRAPRECAMEILELNCKQVAAEKGPENHVMKYRL